MDHRLSLSEAFKLIDSDFDGALSPQDLNGFLQNSLKVDVNLYQSNLQRLFKLFDASKSGKIHIFDFEGLLA